MEPTVEVQFQIELLNKLFMIYQLQWYWWEMLRTHKIGLPCLLGVPEHLIKHLEDHNIKFFF